MSWFEKIFGDGGFYSKKCTTDRHCFKVKTPTLARRVILMQDKPCQCGHYTDVKMAMREDIATMERILKELKEEKKA